MLIAKQMATLGVIFSACYLFCLAEIKKDRLHDCPSLMLWAWERPEDLRFIDPARVGVAYLASTVSIRDRFVSVYQRRQALEVPGNTYVMAVVRLESDNKNPPLFDDAQIETIVQDILGAGSGATVNALQVDFDARESEREAYRKILCQVRKALPASMPLSMTALASWCASNSWLESLPVDEAVPMFFRMGVVSSERAQYLKYLPDPESLAAGSSLRAKYGRSIGLATDEMTRFSAFRNRRIYLFSPHRWTSRQLRSLAQSKDSTRFHSPTARGDND